jgi:hypothetical protein
LAFIRLPFSPSHIKPHLLGMRAYPGGFRPLSDQ